MNFPNTHYLSRPPTVVNNADVVSGLELSDFWAVVNAYIDNGEHGIGVNTTRIKPDTKLISINSSELLTKANYQDFQRFQVGRCLDGGGCGSDAAGADRGGEVGDPQRPQGRDRKARRGRQEGLCGGPRAHQAGGGGGLGRKPDQHGAARDGDLRADQGPRLVAGRVLRQRQQLARAGSGRWTSITTTRPLGRLRRRLRRAGLGRRRARQPRSSAGSRSRSSRTAT